MGRFFYVQQPFENLTSIPEAKTSSGIMFSNTTEYQPLFFFDQNRSQDERKFVISDIAASTSLSYITRNNLIYKYIHCPQTRDNVFAYRRRASNSRFELRLYFCMSYFPPSNETNVLYALCAPTAMIDIVRSSITNVAYGGVTDENNPRTIVPFLRGRRVVRFTDSFRSIDTNFLEFWISDMLHPSRKKDMSLAYKAEANTLILIIELMRIRGVKVVYKSKEEMNTLYYRPKVETYSVEMLNNWKANLTKMTVDAFANQLKL